MESDEIEQKKQKYKKKLIISFIFTAVNLTIVLYLYYLLSTIGAHPLIIILIILFALLTFIGPLLRGKRKRSMYSEMFPDKRKEAHQKFEEYQLNIPPDIQIKPINLDFEYKKPHVRKCKNCKMIVPKFVKKCPICGEPIKD